MADLSSNTRDNEQNKFAQVNDKVVVNTQICQDDPIQVEFASSTAGTPETFNVNMTTSGNEYFLDLPLDTKKFSMKLKDNDSKFEVYYVTGGADSYTIGRGSEYSEESIKIITGNQRIFFKGFKNNIIMEFITWR